MRTCARSFLLFFFFNDTATTEIYTLSLHDALPISCTGRRPLRPGRVTARRRTRYPAGASQRSEEHTSELQSPCNLVCRLLLEKKKTMTEAALRFTDMLTMAPEFATLVRPLQNIVVT